MPDHSYQTRRLLLRTFPGIPEIERVAGGHGWPQESVAARSEMSVEATWNLGIGVTMHCIDDRTTRHSYVFMTGNIANFAEAYLGMVEDDVDFWLPFELVHRVDQATDPVGRGKAIIGMAIAAPYEGDTGVAQRIIGAAQQEDFRLRDMAMWAMSLCPYPEFRLVLQKIASDDPEEMLRDRARMLLEAFDRAGVGEP